MKPKLTEAHRSRRFEAMAREIGAEGEAPGFDRTLERLAEIPKEPVGKDR